MAEAVPKLRWNSLSSASHSTTTRLSPPHRLRPFHRIQPTVTTSPARTRCKAVEIGTPAPAAARTKKNKYEIENLTTWLLKQEQAGHIDAELTIVLSSISLACKQIASLLQRSSIINLTGAHGTINIQGEDQKKLDVIANEVSSFASDFSIPIHTFFVASFPNFIIYDVSAVLQLSEIERKDWNYSI